MMRLFSIGCVLVLLSPAISLAQSTAVATITMTEAGFQPEQVSISKGDTVIFMNASKEPHWPASNIHPTHSVYPGSGIEKCGTNDASQIFDACGGVAPGRTYSFTFTHPGEWRFHDHLNPTHTGSVTVKGTGSAPSTSVPSVMQRLRDAWGSFVRTAKRLLARRSKSDEVSKLDMFALTKDQATLMEDVHDFGGKALMLRLIEQSKGGSAQDCHQEAHKLGRASYEVSGKDAFKEGDSSCHSGFYHGAMEAFLRDRGTGNLAASIQEVCNAFKTSFSRFECLHGVGHGLLAYEDYDLPRTLNECQQLGDQFSISSCYGGMFMENIVTAQGWGATADHATNWVKRDDPQFPCNAVEKNPQALYQCYLMQTSWMLTISKYDFAWAAKQCILAPSDMVDVCYQSLGRDAAGYTLREPEKILALCDDVPAAHRYRCIVGAVNVIIDFWGEKLQGQASELCRLAKEGKHECFSTLATRIPELFSDSASKKRVCDTVDPAYRQFCQ